MTKRVIKIENHKFIDSFTDNEEAKDYDLLIEIEAVSINPADARKVEKLNPNRSKIVGYDGTGNIIAKGDKVKNFEIGDKVFFAGSNIRAGSFQEQQLVDSRLVAKVPVDMPVEQLVGFPLVSLTAYEILFEKFNFLPQESANKGQSILIINGAGGVGSVASQLAKWSGLNVYATSSPKNFTWLRDHGVDQPVDYHMNTNDSLDKLADNSFEATVSFYDISGYLPELIRLTKPFGHIGTIVGVDGPLDITPMQRKSLSFDWELMFTKFAEDYHIETQGEILKKIAQLIDNNVLKRIDTQTINGLNAKSLNLALEQLNTGHNVGKIILVK